MHLFDEGWEKLRETIFANQKRLGVVPLWRMTDIRAAARRRRIKLPETDNARAA